MTDLQTELAALIAEASASYWCRPMPVDADVDVAKHMAERLASAFEPVEALTVARALHFTGRWSIQLYRFARPESVELKEGNE